jgi:hypothetical protein
MPDATTNGIAERISVHETEITSLKGQVSAIFNKLDRIETLIGDSKKTNWGLIVSVIGVGISAVGGIIVLAVAFNAARVVPLENEIARTQSEASILAAAKLEQDRAVFALQKNLAEHETVDSFTQATLKEFAIKGTPETDKRLTLLEYRLQQLEAKR